MSDAASYTSTMKRIQSPDQPAAVQRLAVMELFEKLKREPDKLAIKSSESINVVRGCLCSGSGPVVDEGARQVCRLVEEGLMQPLDALYHLQIAVEEAPRNCDVVVLSKAIGYISRFLYTHRHPQLHDVFAPASPFQHPFVKVLTTRLEAHMEILKQVLLLITEVKFINYMEFDKFLRPIYMFSILQLRVSSMHASFAQRLHSQLVTWSYMDSLQGSWALKLLVDCIKYYPLQSTDSIAIIIGFIEELANTFELAFLKSKIKDKLCEEIFFALMMLFSELVDRSIDSSSVLLVLKRLLLIKFDVDHFGFCNIERTIADLGHLLTILEYEHEQILLLNLLLHIMEKVTKSGIQVFQKFDGEGWILSTLLFPVLHAMSSPSKYVKGAALQLLTILKSCLESSEISMLHLSRVPDTRLYDQRDVGTVVHEFVRSLYFKEDCFITWCPCSDLNNDWLASLLGRNNKFKVWLDFLKQYFEKSRERSNCFAVLCPHQRHRKGTILVLSTVFNALILHPNLNSLAIEALSIVARYEPSLAVSFSLTLFFFLEFFQKNEEKSSLILLDILAVLPCLGRHSATLPLVIQTLQPMLHKDAKRELQVTALRLLCKTWEFNSRVFVHLQKFLHPKLLCSTLDEDLAVSIAACVRDVCRKDVDNGVDIILSVQACIESRFPVVKSLGLQSLASLCEHDVIDFYTAWAVVSKHVHDDFYDARLADSLCVLLRWGAMDAEAYSEVSYQILQHLWKVASSSSKGDKRLLVKARVSAVQALTFYEESYVLECLPGIRENLINLLVSEEQVEVHQIIVELMCKFIEYENKTRQRFRKTGRPKMTKVEKLMYSLPKIVSLKGIKNGIAEFPGVLLLCWTDLPLKETIVRKNDSKELLQWQAKYESDFLEIANCLQISGNLCVSLVSLQSWQYFICRWLRAKMMAIEVENKSYDAGKILTMAANGIFEHLKVKADEVVPRVAENVILAIGALCSVLPSSLHSVSASAKSFLLECLLQDAHEYKQWTSALSLGLVAAKLHPTDLNQKSEIVNYLFQVSEATNQSIVMGACSIGLGFTFYGFCNDNFGNTMSVEEIRKGKNMEKTLVDKILCHLIQLLCNTCKCAPKSLEKLNQFGMLNYGICKNKVPENCHRFSHLKAENLWGIAGLVIGLAMSSEALLKYGTPRMVLELTDILIAWILFPSSHQEKSVDNSVELSDFCVGSLAVGSCISLSTALSICQKLSYLCSSDSWKVLEKLNITEKKLESLVNELTMLIYKISSKPDYGYLHQNLLMACCIGSGNVLSCILNESKHSIKLEDAKQLIEAIRKTYKEPNSPVAHFGGMMGIVYTINGGAGLIDPLRKEIVDIHVSATPKETSCLRGPILSNACIEQYLLSLISEIVEAVQKPNDKQLQTSAAWAISVLRSACLNDGSSISSDFDVVVNDSSQYSYNLNDLAKDTVIYQLSSFLLNTNTSETETHFLSNKLPSIMQCLEKASILPLLDWGGLIKNFMEHFNGNLNDNSIAGMLSSHCSVREACVSFSFAHAQSNTSLLKFIDELCHFSCFSLLEYSLQALMLDHIQTLVKIFSHSRVEKFFLDLMVFFSKGKSSESPDNGLTDVNYTNGLLRIVFWRSVGQLVKNSYSMSESYMPCILNSLEAMFQLLPFVPLNLSRMFESGSTIVAQEDEWSYAVKCLKYVPKQWVLEKLLCKATYSINDGSSRILILSRLVADNYLDHSELTKFRFHILNTKSNDNWRLLVEVAISLQHASFEVKKQWLLEIIETIHVTKHPSMALKFLGLLSSSWSPFAPCLILDPSLVLEALPHTLLSLFCGGDWSYILNVMVQRWLGLIEHACSWKLQLINDIQASAVSSDEMNECDILLNVLQRTCIAFRDHLPFDALFKISNIVSP